jgi:two-component sensor histidine kinase
VSLQFRSPSGELHGSNAELFLREMMHRCNNDIQLIVGLLSLQARRSRNPEVRSALTDAAERISTVARARSAALRDQPRMLDTALRQVCEALQPQAEPRSITLCLEVGEGCDGLNAVRIPAIALAVNELATNAIKHAFDPEHGGRIRISSHPDGDEIVVIVDADGLPFSDGPGSDGGLGLELVKLVIGSSGGSLRRPDIGSKRFEIVVPRT